VIVVVGERFSHGGAESHASRALVQNNGNRKQQNLVHLVFDTEGDAFEKRVDAEANEQNIWGKSGSASTAAAWFAESLLPV